MAEKITKNISLTSHLDKYIDAKVRSGRYQSASEVVREGLRLLQERDAARAQIRQAIEEGWLQSERGEGRDGEQFMNVLRQKLVRTAKGRNKAKATRAKA